MLEYPDSQKRLTTVSGGGGHATRLKRIFSDTDGRALVLGVDHPLFSGFVEGLQNRGSLLSAESEGIMDSLLASQKTFTSFDLSDRTYGKLMRVDTNAAFLPLSGKQLESALIVSDEEIVTSGVDGVTCFFLTNSSEGRVADHRGHLIAVSRICRRLAYPLVVEALCVDGEGRTVRDTGKILSAATTASELGADILKIDAPEALEDLEDVVSAIDRPVLIRGGDPKGDRRLMLKEVEMFMRAGAAGIVFGRSIFQAPDPLDTMRDLYRVVHGMA